MPLPLLPGIIIAVTTSMGVRGVYKNLTSG